MAVAMSERVQHFTHDGPPQLDITFNKTFLIVEKSSEEIFVMRCAIRILKEEISTALILFDKLKSTSFFYIYAFNMLFSLSLSILIQCILPDYFWRRIQISKCWSLFAFNWKTSLSERQSQMRQLINFIHII